MLHEDGGYILQENVRATKYLTGNVNLDQNYRTVLRKENVSHFHRIHSVRFEVLTAVPDTDESLLGHEPLLNSIYQSFRKTFYLHLNRSWITDYKTGSNDAPGPIATFNTIISALSTSDI